MENARVLKMLTSVAITLALVVFAAPAFGVDVTLTPLTFI